MRNLTQQEIEAHNRYYREAWTMIREEILIGNRSDLGPPGYFTRRKIKKAIELFEKALEIDPDHWQSMWALGKIYQRLEENETALSWFQKAYQAEPGNPDISREAAICAMDLGKPDDALAFAAVAAQLKPDDAGLQSNLALALLIAGQAHDALATAQAALNANPQDPINRAVVDAIQNVIAGKLPYPKTPRDLERTQ